MRLKSIVKSLIIVSSKPKTLIIIEMIIGYPDGQPVKEKLPLSYISTFGFT